MPIVSPRRAFIGVDVFTFIGVGVFTFIGVGVFTKFRLSVPATLFQDASPPVLSLYFIDIYIRERSSQKLSVISKLP